MFVDEGRETGRLEDFKAYRTTLANLGHVCRAWGSTLCVQEGADDEFLCSRFRVLQIGDV